MQPFALPSSRSRNQKLGRQKAEHIFKSMSVQHAADANCRGQGTVSAANMRRWPRGARHGCAIAVCALGRMDSLATQLSFVSLCMSTGYLFIRRSRPCVLAVIARAVNTLSPKYATGERQKSSQVRRLTQLKYRMYTLDLVTRSGCTFDRCVQSPAERIAYFSCCESTLGFDPVAGATAAGICAGGIALGLLVEG
jgi:hypothetical protein